MKDLSDYTACVADTDCKDDQTCATYALDTVSGGACLDMDKDVDDEGCGSAYDVANSLN